MATDAQRGDALLHPVSMVAVALLVLNDHVLKAAMPGLMTGKLSDAAGMVFFPLLLVSVAEWVDPRRPFAPRPRVLRVAVVATGAVFAATNVWTPAAEAYRQGLAALQYPFRAVGRVLAGDGVGAVGTVDLTMDPTDLAALPFLGLALWVGHTRINRGQDESC